ncbi:MAG: response regulator transcription factor [Ilumatobacteraceae bacterium]
MIVEDHDVLSQALGVALRDVGIDVTVAADLEREALVAEITIVGPDVVLLDLYLGVHGTSHKMVADLVSLGCSVIVLTASEDRHSVAEAIREGAYAYVHKSEPFDRLVQVIRDVANGHGMAADHRDELVEELRRHDREQHPLLGRFRNLSAREQSVLEHLIAGRTPVEIAELEYVAVSTVRSQQKAIYRKLGVNSQLAAVAIARRAGWTPPV